jgi:hypothetical protein
MRRLVGLRTLRTHASDLADLVRKVEVGQLLDDLNRFVNRYRISLEEARRAVLVLHGIPPGLAGPEKRRFTWQSNLALFYDKPAR